MIARLRRNLAGLHRDNSGLAAVEFALTSPILLTMFLYGAELTNYTITKMRISQVALHVADNASRIGTYSLLTNPQISETQINDLFTGANLQAGALGLEAHGKVVLSSLEPLANPNTSGRYKIRWQRCFGNKTYTSLYGTQGTTNLNPVNPPGQGQGIAPPDDGALMLVEISYDYQPIITSRFAPRMVLSDFAAMTVRDDRDYAGNSGSGVYNNENATQKLCS